MDAAIEVFGDLGYEGTSVRALTRRLGVSHGLLHAKFGSKRKLWEAAVDHGLGRLRARVTDAVDQLEPGAGPTERLRSLSIAFLLGVAQAPAILKLMNYEGARDSERLDYIAEKFIEAETFPFAEIIAEGIESGDFRDVSVPTVFLMLAHGGGALFSLRPLARHLGVRSRRSDQTVLAQAEEIVDVLLRGLAPSVSAH